MRKLLVIVLICSCQILLAQEKLNLENCIKMALEKNPDMVISQQQLKSAEIGLTASKSGILPSVGFGVNSSFSTQGPREAILFGEKISVGKESLSFYGLGMNYSQTLYDGGISWKNIKLAENGYKEIKIGRDQARQIIISTVTENFYLVLKAQELLRVYNKSLENSREQLKKSEQMFNIGQVAKKDLYQARVTEGSARLQIIQQKQAINRLMSNLKTSMGYSDAEEFSIYENNYVAPDAIDLATAKVKALGQNNELQILLAQKKSKKIQYDIAKANWMPVLSVNGGYNRGHSDLSKTISEFDKWWDASLTFNLGWSIFNGFQRKVNIQQTQIDYNLFDEKIRKKKLSVHNRIDDLVNTLEMYREMIEINKLNIEAAAEDLRLAQEMYRLNSATLLEVLNAQASLTRAEGTQVTTKYDAKIIEIRLAYLMGTI